MEVILLVFEIKQENEIQLNSLIHTFCGNN